MAALLLLLWGLPVAADPPADEAPAGFATKLPRSFTNVAVGDVEQGSLENRSTWYRFHFDERTDLRVTFNGSGLRVDLFSGDGSPLFDGKGTDSPLILTWNTENISDFYMKISGRGRFDFTSELISFAGTMIENESRGEILLDRLGLLNEGDAFHDDGSYYENHTVTVEAGDRIRVTLLGANYDPYLIVVEPSGEMCASDDVSANDRNCRIEFTAKASGDLAATASSSVGRTTGDYRLLVERLNNFPVLESPPPDTRPVLTVIFTRADAERSGMMAVPTALAVSPRGNVIIASGGDLFDVEARRFLLRTPGQAGHCAYSPSGALLAITGRTLGYYAVGEINPRVTVPENGMKVVSSRDAMYLFGGGRRSGALYLIDSERGAVKLFEMPQSVGAADVVGDTLYFSVANDVYRFARSGGLQLLCRLPGPVITSLAAGDREEIYFTAGRSLYAWLDGSISLISAAVGDLVGWHSSGLYVLDSGSRTLVRLEQLP